MRVYLVLGKILNLIGQIFMIFENFWLLLMAQYWKDNLAIWSRWRKSEKFFGEQEDTEKRERRFKSELRKRRRTAQKHVWCQIAKLWFMALVYRMYFTVKIDRAVLVAQLVEQSLPEPEIRGRIQSSAI